MKHFKRIFCLALALALTFVAAGCGKTTTKMLDAQFTDVKADTFFTMYAETGLRQEAILKGFDFTEADFKAKFNDNRNSWTGNQLEMKLTNNNDFPIEVLGLEIKNNGSKKVYVSKFADAGYGLPAKYDGEMTMYFWVLAESSLGTESEILDQIKKMDIRVAYVDKESGIESFDDVTKDNAKQVKYDVIAK